jgi:hypothetical protein
MTNLALIVISSMFAYFPAIANFFSADDWFHLSIANIHSFLEFLNFFSFAHTAQSASFYRPLSTQLFFYIFQTIFGLNSPPYYLFVILCFGISLYLIYIYISTITKNNKLALISLIIYGFSVSNFTRIYFLSAFQEIALVIFSILFLISHLKDRKIKYLFFVLALMSKETAIMLPIIASLADFAYRKINFRKLLPLLIIVLPYLYLRFIVFGTAQGGDSYLWNFSPIRATNTLMWYLLWSLGSPELLVDYIGSGLIPIARFFTDFQNVWVVILLPLIILVTTIFTLVLKHLVKLEKLDKNLIFGSVFFLVSLLPVVFLPQHKFALELGLPLIGFSIAISSILVNEKIVKAFLALYILYNLSMNYLTYLNHYSVNRSQISQKVYQYIKEKYPVYPTGYYFYFINNKSAQQNIWGQSKQVAQSLSNSDFFKVFYKDKSVKVYYEDFPENLPGVLTPIKIDSQLFISNL